MVETRAGFPAVLFTHIHERGHEIGRFRRLVSSKHTRVKGAVRPVVQYVVRIGELPSRDREHPRLDTFAIEDVRALCGGIYRTNTKDQRSDEQK